MANWEGQRGRAVEVIYEIEGVIIELGRNLMLGKFPGIHKNDPR